MAGVRSKSPASGCIGADPMALKSYAGGVVFGERHGAGPPTVLALHGWGRDHSDFDRVLAGRDAVALDLPGFGATPPPDAVWGAADYAQAVLPVLDEFEAPPVVIGHSFGGRVATMLADRYRDRVASLLLIGVPLLRAPHRRAVRPPVAFRLARTLNRIGVLSDERMEAARRRHGSADYRAATGVMRDILVRAVHETYEAELARMAVPVRLLWGADDTAAPIAIAEEAERLVAAAGAAVHLTVLPGVGHHVMAAAPQAVEKEIETLLGYP